MVILPGVEFGNGNFSNLVSVKESMVLGKKVIVIDGKDIKERDHTSGKAAELYRKITDEGAQKINNIEQILRSLKKISP